ncbi:CoA transferase [Rhodoferax sp.]|uniref:CoA transferase n=1 Tax=Rhodoferax sp. TaxID=50421 RepID=UPI002845DEB8|nr:CoA transferase [Rhodoferax sp.]MDR3371855.1 CoA transferase [Rhodoferax sp.]
MTLPSTTLARHQPLTGVRILSLSLNLPGPAAMQRLQKMGATCVKLEPPAPQESGASGVEPGITGDPMSLYSPAAYLALHDGIQVQTVNLKTDAGQARLHDELAQADVLMTSFRPSALRKLGLDWAALQPRYSQLSMVAIVGAPGAQADLPGHDLTYVAENNLITGLDLPATLYADMSGALMASEAVLQALLAQRQSGQGCFLEVALSDAAAHLALPRTWGATLPGTLLGGGHAGYRVYPCLDGRVAMAALEPHFAQSLCTVAGLPWHGPDMMLEADTHQAVASFVATLSCDALKTLAAKYDIPLHTLPN